MDEKKISNIALITVIIGILSLLVISYFLDYKETKIIEIDGSYLGKNVKVIGEVQKFNDYKTVKTFMLKDETGEIMIAIFTENLEVEGKVEVVGSVEDYNGNLEIIAYRISQSQ